MEKKRKLKSDRGAAVDRAGYGTSVADLQQAVARKSRSQLSKRESRKRPRLERMGSTREKRSKSSRLEERRVGSKREKRRKSSRLEERRVGPKREKKGKRPRLERRVGSVDRIGEEAVTLSEGVEEETGKSTEKAEDLEDVVEPSGEGGTAATEGKPTSKQPVRDGSLEDFCDPHKVWVRGLPFDITDDGIRTYFANCGEISEFYCSGRFLRSYSLKRCITFATKAGATKSLEYDGSDIGCRLHIWRFMLPQEPSSNRGWVNVQKTPGLLSARIGNLPESADRGSIRAFFKESYSATKIESVRCLRGRCSGNLRRTAYVHFGNDESLEAAMKLNQTCLLGRPVKIAYAVPRDDLLQEKKRFVDERFGSRSVQKPFRIGPCFICGNDGHTLKTCPEKKCYPCDICGQFGHNHTKCPEKGFYWGALRRAAPQSSQPVHTYFSP